MSSDSRELTTNRTKVRKTILQALNFSIIALHHDGYYIVSSPILAWMQQLDAITSDNTVRMTQFNVRN